MYLLANTSTYLIIILKLPLQFDKNLTADCFLLVM